MREFKINSLVEFLSRPLWDTHTMIFRGVSKASYELIPSVYRLSAKDGDSALEFEQFIFQEFQERALPFINSEPKTQIEWLFLAQHYGIPTRLLDWTTNPLVALFFAADKNTEGDFAVYKKIQTEWLNGDVNPFSIDKVYGLRPKHTDVRYINQAGVFTIHPSSVGKEAIGEIAKYLFPGELREEVRWQLGKYGIKSSYIYPSLDGISKDILEESMTWLNGGSMRTTCARDWV